ncbi:delta-sarcoglycan-like [Penaeus monodon]|uniref:delta-sarcoglycan-like n=1 Tax=Penaeus monodon TaxID=6687 RepID=UPI0018A737A2|nr:delta-sarcoglycan-like [Penaeus monodon]
MAGSGSGGVGAGPRGGTGGGSTGGGVGRTLLATSNEHRGPPPSGTVVQCGPYQYSLGLFGWRRRCLYALVLLLLVMVTLNLALTLFILRVLDVSLEGMGGLQIVRGGMVASGDVHVMDSLVAARIVSRPHTPIRILAAHNFSISAMDAEGRVTTTLSMNTEAMECTSDRLVIRDKKGRLLFSASREEVLVGAPHLTVTGEGGAVFSGSVQTSHVTAPISESLLLESMTRSLEVTAPEGIALESRAGTISALSLSDLTLQSKGGIMFETPNIIVRDLKVSNTPISDPLDDVFQVCVCSNGRLFLAKPGGVCAADQNFCK